MKTDKLLTIRIGKSRAAKIFQILALVLLFVSCNLEDFDINKLTKPDQLKPKVFAPLAWGNYIVSLIPGFPSDPAAPLPWINDTLTLNPLIYSFDNISIPKNVVEDTLFLKVKLVHGITKPDVELYYKMGFYKGGLLKSGEYNCVKNKTKENDTIVTVFPLLKKDLIDIDDSDELRFQFFIKRKAGDDLKRKDLAAYKFWLYYSFYTKLNFSDLK